MAVIEIIILLAVIWALVYHRAKPVVWTACTALVLFVFSIFNYLSWWALAPIWFIFLVLAIFANFSKLRARFFSLRVLKIVNKKLPQMSQTEKIALEAGDTWWEKSLFQGDVNWQQLLNYPKPTLTEDEQRFIDNQVEQLCGMIDDWEISHYQLDMSKKVWDFLKKEGFFGLVIDKQYGGHGFSAYAHSSIVTKIASRSYTVALNTMVPNSLGPAELLTHYGTTEQKNYYLPRLAKGDDIPCFGLTSPFAGSDAGNIPDTGVVCKGTYAGKEIVGIRINFFKHYITLAPIATLLGIAFKLYDPEHLIGDQDYLGITLCLIPADLPGITIGNRHLPLNLAFMNGPMRGEDVFIPLDMLIGGQAMAGQGWKMLMECLGIGRGISLPSLATATAKLCYRMTGAYARVREQFKTPIGMFQGVSEAMGRIGGFTYICEATRQLTTVGIDSGLSPSLVSAMSKYHLTEMARQLANDAMDIHGGRGIQLGSRNYLGQVYMSLPISITVEGANILTRNLIIFGQGATRCHPFVLAEMQAIAEQNAAKFDQLLMGHIGYFSMNVAKCLFFGITRGRFIAGQKHDWTAYYFRQLSRMSTALAMTADMAMMIMGGKLKREESLSARLGDVLSSLYLASAVLKYYHQNDDVADKSLAKWALDYCLYQISQAFDGFFANFPQRTIANILQRVIFPFRGYYAYPSDILSQRIALEMMQSTRARERLTEFCYISKETHEATGRMEAAFQASIAAQDARIKLTKALHSGGIPRDGSLEQQLSAAQKANLISEEESTLILESHRLMQDAVLVDEFLPTQLARKKTNARKINSKDK